MKRKYISNKTKAKVWNKYNGRCSYCGIKLNPFDFHVDHKVPFSRGGVDEIGNYYPSCSECNITKGTKSVVEWKAELMKECGILLSKTYWKMMKSEGMIERRYPEIIACEVPFYFYMDKFDDRFYDFQFCVRYKSWHETIFEENRNE